MPLSRAARVGVVALVLVAVAGLLAVQYWRTHSDLVEGSGYGMRRAPAKSGTTVWFPLVDRTGSEPRTVRVTDVVPHWRRHPEDAVLTFQVCKAGLGYGLVDSCEDARPAVAHRFAYGRETLAVGVSLPGRGRVEIDGFTVYWASGLRSGHVETGPDPLVVPFR